MEPNWSNPRVAVVGSGAIGAYYGGRLAQHGHDVHFLLRSEYEVVRARGWTIKSHLGDFRLDPARLHVYNRSADMPPADLVLIATKTTSNRDLPALLRPLLGSHTVLMTIQNGLGNEQFLSELVTPHRVLGALAFVCINREEPGVVNHIAHGTVAIGEFAQPGITPRLRQIGQMMQGSRIDIRLLQNLHAGRWEKLLWNVPFSGLGAALDLTSDRLIATPEGESLVRQAMKELQAAAAALGLKVEDSAIERQISNTRSMGPYQSSMQIDRRMKRPLEVDAILTQPLLQARKAEVSTPVLEMIERLARLVSIEQ